MLGNDIRRKWSCLKFQTMASFFDSCLIVLTTAQTESFIIFHVSVLKAVCKPSQGLWCKALDWPQVCGPHRAGWHQAVAFQVRSWPGWQAHDHCQRSRGGETKTTKTDKTLYVMCNMILYIIILYTICFREVIFILRLGLAVGGYVFVEENSMSWCHPWFVDVLLLTREYVVLCFNFQLGMDLRT